VFVVVIVSAPASTGIETFGPICGDVSPGPHVHHMEPQAAESGPRWL